MLYVLIPILIILATAVGCLNFAAGFWASDKTEGSGFALGFYGMVVLGLFAAEISFVIWVINTFGMDVK